MVLRALGNIEGTLDGFKESIVAGKNDRQEFRRALDVMDAKLEAHVTQLNQYRNWMIGFGAGVTFLFSAMWGSGIEVVKSLFSR